MQKSKLQFKIQNYFLAILAMFILLPSAVFSAELRMDAKSQKINVGDQFQINVILNTEGEELNAIEGNIIFPSDLIALKEINDGNSIINFWIEKPKGMSEGQIAFSGIVPGGYTGNQGLIFSIAFLAKKEGNGAIEFSGVKTLRNDGKGTAENTTIFNLQFAIYGQAPASQPAAVEKKDVDMPETFEPAVASDQLIFGGKYFLVFAAQDKGSGIGHYEVLETRNKALGIRSWTRAESPYILRDQKLKSYVYVKATDKAGNERIVIVEPQYPLKWYEQPFTWGIIILIMAALYIIVKILWTGKFREQQRI